MSVVRAERPGAMQVAGRGAEPTVGSVRMMDVPATQRCPAQLCAEQLLLFLGSGDFQ